LLRGESPQRKSALVEARRTGFLTGRGSRAHPANTGKWRSLIRTGACIGTRAADARNAPPLAVIDGGDAERFVSYPTDDASLT
jgi:hypothetical protein